MGAYEELNQMQRKFIDDYLSNPDKPAWKSYHDIYDCEESTAKTNSSETLNKTHVIQAIAQLLGPTKTAIVVKMSKLGDRAVKELKELMTVKPISKVQVGEGEELIDNREIKLESIKTFFDRIGIEGSGDDINIAINGMNQGQGQTPQVDLSKLSEEKREDFLKASREVYIE